MNDFDTTYDNRSKERIPSKPCSSMPGANDRGDSGVSRSKTKVSRA